MTPLNPLPHLMPFIILFLIIGWHSPYRMAELLQDAPETPLLMTMTKKNSHILLVKAIRTSMQNVESVAQKIAELLH